MRSPAPFFSTRCRLSELPARAREAARAATQALPDPLPQVLRHATRLTAASAVGTLAVGLLLHACCDAAPAPVAPPTPCDCLATQPHGSSGITPWCNE